MKKILMIAPVVLILLCASVIAAESNLKIGSAVVYDDGYGVNAFVKVINGGFKSLSNLRASLYIPDTDFMAKSSTFRLSAGKSTVKQILLDSSGIEPGEYYVRVSVGNGDARKVKYRMITIE